MKYYFIGFVTGILLLLFVSDRQKTQQYIRTNYAMTHACSQALFDNDSAEDWNVYAISVCQDMSEIKKRLDLLEGN